MAHELWHDAAILQLRPGDPQVAPFRASLPFTEPVHVAAVFYRKTACGDLVGYLQALGDLLEHAGILENDVLIASWDRSRLRKDAARPRIELTVCLMAEDGSAEDDLMRLGPGVPGGAPVAVGHQAVQRTIDEDE